jgi:hypothetical protein
MLTMDATLRVVPDEAVVLSPLERLERDELRLLALGVGAICRPRSPSG